MYFTEMLLAICMAVMLLFAVDKAVGVAAHWNWGVIGNVAGITALMGAYAVMLAWVAA